MYEWMVLFRWLDDDANLRNLCEKLVLSTVSYKLHDYNRMLIHTFLCKRSSQLNFRYNPLFIASVHDFLKKNIIRPANLEFEATSQLTAKIEFNFIK